MKISCAGLLWLLLAGSFAFCRSQLLAADDEKRPPNVVFIFADDLGWTDLGCFGSKYYETPNIDKLRADGMKWTNAYSCGPNCAPTRACLMSGRYGPRHGIYTVGSGARGMAKHRKMKPVQNVTQLPLTEKTLADVFKAAGYKTASFGKWHLGNGPEHHPTKRGFDEGFVSAGRHFNFRTVPKQDVKAGTYLADYLTDRAVDFIERSKDKPFFLYLPHFAVHSPFEAKKNLIAKFQEKKPVGGHRNPTYAAMIASLDESVGRVVAKLDELKLSDKTIVIFYGDNGGLGGYRRAGVIGSRDISDNKPLRGGKGMLYEGGIRVPMIVKWPGVVKSGTTCDEPVCSVDFLPTFAEVSGSELAQKLQLDGLSIASSLKSQGKGSLKRDAVYWHFPGYLQANAAMGTWRTTPAGAIRSGDFKLIEFFETGKTELYNLKEDVGEANDLSAKMPDKAKSLHAMLKDWRKKVNAPMPVLK